MPFRPKTKDDQELYKCARFCHRIAQTLLEFLPKTRASQATLVMFLREQIAKSGEIFSIGRDFLTQRIGCTDSNLVDGWTATPEELAWLMVHEQLSNYFGRFVIDNWNPEVYLIHHVPKSGGTSVCEVVHQQSCFVAYPHTRFDVMTQSTGLLGFGLQLEEFEQVSRQDRIYVGGHFNLPETLAKFGRDVQCRGISLTRSPVDSVSSAIRYVWTMVEQGNADWTRAYSSLDPEQLRVVRTATTVSQDPDSLTAMRNIAGTIMQAAEFQESYFDLLSKYYYNDNVKDTFALQRLFSDHPELMPCVDATRDEDLICWQLRIDGPIPRLNASLFSPQHLARAFGGSDAFHAVIAPTSPRSSEIFGALCVIQTLSARPVALKTAGAAC